MVKTDFDVICVGLTDSKGEAVGLARGDVMRVSVNEPRGSTLRESLAVNEMVAVSELTNVIVSDW
jgi:hypothetical protein